MDEPKPTIERDTEGQRGRPETFENTNGGANMNARSIATLALAPMMLFMLGCPAPEEREDVDPWDEPAVTDERETHREAAAEFNIDEMADSGVDGTVRLSGTAQAVQLAIVLDDVEERYHGQQFTAVLHRGTCEQPGERVTDLTTVQAMDHNGMFNGNGVFEDDQADQQTRDPQAQQRQQDQQWAADADTARASLSMQELQPGEMYLVMIHDMQNQPVACGAFPDTWEQDLRDHQQDRMDTQNDTWGDDTDTGATDDPGTRG